MKEVNWIGILKILAEADAFGHESWFEIGVEQHKKFYYCLLGDCSAPSAMIQEARQATEPLPSERLFLGTSGYSWEVAVQEALFKWLERSLMEGKVE